MHGQRLPKGHILSSTLSAFDNRPAVTMKLFIAAVLLLSASSNAFSPSTHRATLTSLPTTTALAAVNPVVKVAAQGMGLLKPIFALEAQLQAAIIGAGVDAEEVADEIQREISANKVLMYTYGLSPFSNEAVSMLSEYPFKKIELGAEWFLLGPRESVARVELGKLVEGGATSLPKVFIGGECIGGCAELAALAESGELDAKMKQAKVGLPETIKKSGLFGLF
jgi:glutaredoxin 3